MELPKELTQLAPKKPPRLRAPTITATTTLATSAGAVQVEASANINDAVTANTTTRQQQSNQTGKAIERNQTELSTEGQQPRAKKKQLHFQSPLHDRTTPQSRDVPVAAGSEAQVAKQTSQVPFDAGRKHDIKTAVIAHDGRPIAAAEQTIWLTYARRRQRRSTDDANKLTSDEKSATAQLLATAGARADADADVDANCSNIKSRLVRGCTSLMHACQHGDMAQVLAQLRAKPERIRQRDSRNKNALHYCAAQQTRDLVAAASIAIAAPELLESADEDGFTPLHLAVIQGNLAMVNLLLANKADVNAVDNEGHSVVHWATVCGEVEALRSVLAAGGNVATPDRNGGTPLHYAAQMCGASYETNNKVGHSQAQKLALEILAILLAHPHSSVDVQDKDGRQPLLWAASAGSAKAVVALVKAGARVESADKDGLTALHCAASRGHTECIDTLISLCGAPTDLIDANGCTALHYAVTLGHADATSRLLDLDADPNRQDRKGRTPAHCGCSKGQFETVKLLKERGANLWLRNAKGDLPVHEAACSGRRELVEWLLEQRPKQINTTSNDGRSLLHIAAANDYTDMCKMLLDYGADANAVYRNAKGMVITPLDCALQKGHRSTAKFLQSQGGLPASKLRLAARRNNPFQDASSDTVRPLKYVEKEELHDLRNSKKYVVYLKHSDSEGNAAVGDGNCSCAERTYRREQRYAHTCRRHQRSRRQLRRRTSSCGEAKEIQRDSDDIDICRSKSNIEIRRRRSRERHGSSSEWDDKEEDEDSCENCCYHKRQKQRVVRRRSTSRRRSNERGERDHSSEKELSPEKRVVREIEVMREKQEQHQTISNGTGKDGGAEVESAEKSSRPQSAIKRQVPGKEATFIKSPTPSGYAAEESHAVALTDDEDQSGKAAELVTTQVDVHREADAASLKTSEETDQKAATESAGNSQTLLGEITDEVKREVEQVVKIAALAVESEIKNGASAGITETVVAENAEKSETKSGAAVEQIQPNAETASSNAPNNLQTQAPPTPAATPTPVPSSTPLPTPEMTLAKETESSRKSEQTIEKSAETATVTPTPTPVSTPSPATPAATPAEPTKAVSTTDSKTATSGGAETDDQPKQQAQQTPPTREQESRRSFTLLPSDSAEEEDGEELPRKSSFQILKSDDSVGEPDSGAQQQEIEFSDSQVFQIVSEPQTRTRAASKTHMKAELSSAEEDNAIVDTYDDDDYEVEEGGGGERSASKSSTRVNTSNRHGVGSVETAASVLGVYNEYNNSRKRRMKKRVRSGGTSKTRSNWKSSPDEAGGAASAGASVAQSSKDQDSGFEPSPRATKSKIPTPRNVYTAHMPRRHIYATLDGRSCSSRLEGRKPGERGACDMSAVTRSIQRNIRRYYMERKIFQHLLELKSLQIRSNKLNEAVLVKRAVDDYHKSCTALGGETGTRLRRYNFSEYTFKNFELFLYETLKALQKPGTYNFQNINDVYEEAERRLSPDYNAYEKALQCTTKTHRCLHAAHAYTGIPCAAYIPMMNHHTMPKFGFGPYKKTGVGSFYLPKILSSGSGCSGLGGTKVALELSHGKSKQLISLPSDKLDSNKRYYVTFTVKESGAATPANAGADNQATSGNGSCAGGSGGIDATGK